MGELKFSGLGFRGFGFGVQVPFSNMLKNYKSQVASFFEVLLGLYKRDLMDTVWIELM